MPEGEGLRLDRHAEVEAFERLVTTFLRQREAENCLMLGLTQQLRAGTAMLRLRPPTSR